LSCREAISRSTAAIREKKNSVANVAEPTGWPRRRHPEVSSTGTGGAVVSVGWGVTENWVIVSEREVARTWFRDERSGNIEVGGPAQDLSNFQMAPLPILSVLTCSTS